jgi:hypothetical protein
MNDYTPEQLELPFTIIIPLTRGYSTIIDAVDADLAALKWFASPSDHTAYAWRTQQNGSHKFTVRLHAVILERTLGRELIKGELVDHKDGNGLNNARSNLRLATNAQNTINSRRSSRNKSGYKGVSWNKENHKWYAYIKINGRNKHLGTFDTPEDAYAVYCAAAIEHHGEFARLE